MVSFRDYLLLERIVGNTGWVYHRTKNNPEDSDIVKYGIKPSTNQSAMYGRGLYCCYDLDQQLKPDMKKYGAYILKGKIDLNNFAILDIYVYRTSNPKGNFEEHLKQIGTDIGEFQRVFPYTSKIANKIWKTCKQNGHNGIIFIGETDGKVAVIWNRRNFIPYQYSEDDGKTWKKLKPDISSIKRPYDNEYDFDDQSVNFQKILREINKKEKIGDLKIPDEYDGEVILKVKECGNIHTMNAGMLSLVGVKKCKNIYTYQTTLFSARSLQKCENIHCENVDYFGLGELKECGDIDLRNTLKIVLPKLKKCDRIYAPKAQKIIIPKKIANTLGEVDLLIIPHYCEIIHPEDTPQIKVDENVSFKKYLMLKESLVQIPLDTAYEIFKNEYDKSTGSSWSRDKFMGRARAWEFYGDDNGYVAIRRQRSGLVKLVGMAGDNRSKLKGINDLVSMNLPLWGMVSKEIKDIAVRRGMREPNFLERQVLKRSIPPEVLGGAEILEYQKDGGIKLQYPDVGVVVKYLVGTPQYYAKLRELFGDKLKEKILG
jgi:hypothetical protein